MEEEKPEADTCTDTETKTEKNRTHVCSVTFPFDAREKKKHKCEGLKLSRRKAKY